MNNLIMSVGISGSGKTKFLTENFDHKLRVCPDDIRRLLTGDTSDMTRDKEVWQFAIGKTIENLRKYKKSIFDATFVNHRSFMFNTRLILDKIQDLSIDVYVFLPNLILSQKRIKKDLESNVDRSRVPDFVLIQQYKKMENWMKEMKAMEDKIFKLHYIDSITHREVTEEWWNNYEDSVFLRKK